METKKAHFKKLLVTIAILVAINFIGHFFFKRLDLTGDQRYITTLISIVDIDRSRISLLTAVSRGTSTTSS